MDTGAAYNCLAASFYDRYFNQILPRRATDRLAFDASGKEMSIRGEVELNMKLSGPDGTMLVNNICFTILNTITQDVIIGCTTLATLGMKVTLDAVLLNEMKFNRLMRPNPNILSLQFGTTLKIKEAIMVTWPDDQITTTCLVIPDPSFSASVRSGFYSVAMGGCLMDQLGVPQYDTSGHSLSPTLEVKQGPLTSLWMLTFRHEIKEIPAEFQCAWSTAVKPEQNQINNINDQFRIKKPQLSKENIEKMTDGTQLPVHEVTRLINEYRRIFAVTDDDLGKYRQSVSLKLRDPGKTPAYTKPRIVPYRLRPWLDEKLRNMVESGLIAIAKESEFCSPIHIVKKKEPGKYRLTIDYRLLNNMLIQNRWPIPNIRSVLEELSGSRFYSVCDCRSGFWQLTLDEDSRKLTAFAARDRLYQWRVLPMGLSVSPGIFQSVMMDALGPDVHKNCLVYIDDIVVYTETAAEHLQVLRRIFRRLWEAGIRLHPDKSHFGVSKVEFLGYTVSAQGYIPMPSKVESILSIERPTNKTALKSFIGSVAYYTMSLPMLQHILNPLHAITGSKSTFEWKDEHETAFEEAKQVLASCGPLAFPDKSGECQLVLTTDSSDEGYGGVLSERQANGVEKPLGYFSGSYRNSSLNWKILEKELYSFYFGLQYFYVQLMAADFVWRTDNRGLSTLATNPSLRSKPNGAPNSRVIRWLEYIAQFDFTIELRKGDSPEMGLADCLSRFKAKKELRDGATINALTSERIRIPYWTQVGCPLIDFITAQLKDEHLVKQTGEWRRYTKGKRKALFRVGDDGVREIRTKKALKFRAMVPQSMVRSVFDFHHIKSHNSANRMIPEISKMLFIPGLQKKLRRYINGCAQCVAINHRPSTHRQPVKTSTSNHPWANLQADLMGPLPVTLRQNRYVLAVVDEATNWLELRAIRDKTAETVLEAINDVFSARGPPINLQTDGGREFVNDTLDKYLGDLGIYHNRICPYKPTSNGLVEGCMKRIQKQMKLLQATELTWDDAIPWIQLALNWGRQANGYSPWQLMHGWILMRPAFIRAEFDQEEHDKYLESENEWAKAQIIRMTKLITDQFMAKEGHKLAELEKKAPKPDTLKLGQRVLVFFPSLPKSKLFARWKHLYIIREQIDVNTYIVSEEGQSRKRYIVDRRRLRPLHDQISISELEVNSSGCSGEQESEEAVETHTHTKIMESASAEADEAEDRLNDRPAETPDHGPVETQGHPVEIGLNPVETADEALPISLGANLAGGGFAEIEFEVPEEDVIPIEEERPRRRAATRAKATIKKWTDQLQTTS